MRSQVRRALAMVGIVAALLAVGHSGAMAVDASQMDAGMAAPLDLTLVCVVLVAVVITLRTALSDPRVPAVVSATPELMPASLTAGGYFATAARASPAWLQRFQR